MKTKTRKRRPATPRQKAILAFIRDHATGKGFPPTVREIGLRFDITSPNAVMSHIKALEAKGFIRRNPGIARGIQVIAR